MYLSQQVPRHVTAHVAQSDKSDFRITSCTYVGQVGGQRGKQMIEDTQSSIQHYNYIT